MTDSSDGLQLAFLSNLEYFRELTRRSGGTVLDQDGITSFASPHPMPGLVSGVFRTDPATSPADVLERARDFFAPMGRSIPVSALVGPDDDLIAAAVEAGCTIDGPVPLQVLARQRLDAHERADIEFRTVADDAGITDYITVCREAHASYGFPDDLFPALFGRSAAILAPHLHAVVGYDGADPVAAATLFLTHGVAYVGWVAVVSGRRRRGLGAAATAVVVNRGFELGASCSTLLASPMGTAVYRRLGFLDVGALVELVPPSRGG